MNSQVTKHLNSYITKRYYKIALFIAALAIGALSLYYSNNLAKKLAEEEKKNVEEYALAQTNLIFAQSDAELNFYLKIVEGNTNIPVIWQNEENVLIGKNFDSLKMLEPEYLRTKLYEFKELNEPIELEISQGVKNYIYYGESKILKALRYYPFVQLAIIGVFLIMAYLAFSYSRRNEQNQVWVGMSKETAHQLGTPISSLMAWIDILEDEHGKEDYRVVEMKNDLNRLNTITERFSKIGSSPSLIPYNLQEVMDNALGYMEKRSPSHVLFTRDFTDKEILVNMNVPLFEWVIENLCKNAIDAMKGEGKINVKIDITQSNDFGYIEFSDTGSGIPKNLHKTVFKPGYTSKKRGWGLGLSLCKRIIQNYHKGHIFVKESVPGKGTTFRIELTLKK